MILRKPNKWLFFLLSIFFVSCSLFTGHKKLTSKKVIRDGREMLYGKITLEQLFFDYPDWQKEYENYQVQQSILEKLKTLEPDVKVLIFLGTWCSDSEREVPHFFKILDQANLTSKLSVELWAVDRKKNLPNNLSQKYQIEYVPTFIFFKNGQETGRIVESPESLYLEEDVFNILSH